MPSQVVQIDITRSRRKQFQRAFDDDIKQRRLIAQCHEIPGCLVQGSEFANAVSIRIHTVTVSPSRSGGYTRPHPSHRCP